MQLKRSVIISLLWMLLVLVAILHMSIITTVIISIIINLTSILLLLSPFPIPLLNFGTSLLTAFPNGAPASASSSPTARAFALVPPTLTLMVMIPFIVLSARTTAPMRALFMAPMPVGAPTSASAQAVPSLVPPKQLAPQLPEKDYNKCTQIQTAHTTEHKT